MAYRLVDAPEHGCARIQWEGISGHDAQTLVTTDDPDERDARDEAADWLTGHLIDQGGEASAADILKAAKRDGIAERTLRRAKNRAGVKAVKAGMRAAGFGGWCSKMTPPPRRRPHP